MKSWGFGDDFCVGGAVFGGEGAIELSAFVRPALLQRFSAARFSALAQIISKNDTLKN